MKPKQACEAILRINDAIEESTLIQNKPLLVKLNFMGETHYLPVTEVGITGDGIFVDTPPIEVFR